MEYKQFIRILEAFVDNKSKLIVDRNHFVAEVRDVCLAGELIRSDGNIYVLESKDDTRVPAARWLVERVARIPLLANRVLDYLKEEVAFVPPTGELQDELERSTCDNGQPVADVVQSLHTILDREPAGMSRVLYLTSDAGEGKTTVLDRLAREQALAYKEGRSHFLIVPILLGGKPFLRFDDLIVGFLANKLRFQGWYYEGFIEMVRLGIVVPALDGFEELFVQGTAGDVISALGELLKLLDSSGTLILAARRALFEYRDLRTQSRLHDSLRGATASFCSLRLNRWEKAQFVAYCAKRLHPNGENLYDELEAVMGSQHPILTRAVFVKKLVDLSGEECCWSTLLTQLRESSPDWFAQLVGSLLQREAEEKWIDRGQVSRPLLSLEEHHRLLQLAAKEMWCSSVNELNKDHVDVLCEIFANETKKDVSVVSQIKERLTSHALLVFDTASKRFRFDHDEFFHYFLGLELGHALVELDDSDVKSVFRAGSLLQLVADVAASHSRKSSSDIPLIVQLLLDATLSDPIGSYSRDNAGRMVISLLDRLMQNDNMVVSRLSFPQDMLTGRVLTKVRFEMCFFRSTDLKGTRFNDCVFNNCEFEHLGLADSTNSKDTVLDDCSVRSVTLEDGETTIYDPIRISQVLGRKGLASTAAQPPPLIPVEIETELDLRLVQKAVRIFFKATQVNDGILMLRLGQHGNHFVSDVLPRLLRSAVFEEVSFQGSGQKRRFRLGVSMSEIQDAIQRANGSMDEFINAFSERK